MRTARGRPGRPPGRTPPAPPGRPPAAPSRPRRRPVARSSSSTRPPGNTHMPPNATFDTRCSISTSTPSSPSRTSTTVAAGIGGVGLGVGVGHVGILPSSRRGSVSVPSSVPPPSGLARRPASRGSRCRGRAAPRPRARRAARPPAGAGRPTDRGSPSMTSNIVTPSGPARNGPKAAPSGSSMCVPAVQRRSPHQIEPSITYTTCGLRWPWRRTIMPGVVAAEERQVGRARTGTRTTSPTPTTSCRRRCAAASPPATAPPGRRGAGRSARAACHGRTLTMLRGWRAGCEDRARWATPATTSHWHDAYEQPGSSLHRRLQVVIRLIRRAFDELPPGPIRVVSLCAGQGADLLGAADGHPRAHDLTGRLVELDPAQRRAAHGRASPRSGSGSACRSSKATRPRPTPTRRGAGGPRAGLRHLRQHQRRATSSGRSASSRRSAPRARGCCGPATRGTRSCSSGCRAGSSRSGCEPVEVEVADDATFGVGANRLVVDPPPFRARRAPVHLHPLNRARRAPSVRLEPGPIGAHDLQAGL